MITKGTKKYDIYTDNIFLFSKNGVFQASAFIGAVLNEKNIFDITKWNINEYWELIPQLPLDNTILLSKFKSFVVKSALCEMMMDFEQTLLELYDVLLLITKIRTSKKYNITEHLERMDKFQKDSFETKLKRINKFLKNKQNNNQLWKNLKYVRNCITHNNSIVDKGDIKLSIKRIVLTMKDNVTGKIYHNSKDNQEFFLGDLPGHAATLTIDFKTEDKIFKKGSRIKFSNGEIYYLLYTLYESIWDIEILFVNFLINNKVEFGKNEENGIIKSQDELNKQYSNKRELHISLMPKVHQE